MGNFISKVRTVRKDGDTYESIFRIFDQNGTYIELTPAQLWEVIEAGWRELGKPNWLPPEEEQK
jgi:hypothetical protein